MTGTTSLKRLLASIVVAVAFCAPLAAERTQQSGTVTGCLTDALGEPLPGATVDVGGNGTHHTVESDAGGCFIVRDVPAGSYYVFARLQAFVSVTRENVTVEPGRSQRIDLRMQVAPICECSALPNTLPTLWNSADAVVRVRIVGHDPNSPERYRASLLTVWKAKPLLNAPEALTFMRWTEQNEAEPYVAGQEFVIFLEWSAAGQVFVRKSSGNGNVAAFALENGRIHSAPIAAYVGAETERLIDALRSLAGQ